tara:strand:- start:333 stop:788 length:456 start_codon:yes stop_codon:yes gene_type:complete
MYANIQQLKENPEFENLGKRWSTEDDINLMSSLETNIVTKTCIDYNKLALEFKRTIGSVQERIKLNIYKKLDEENTVDILCEKYNIDIGEMNFFIKRKEYSKTTKAVKKEATNVTNEQLYSLILRYQEDLNDIKNTLKKINKKLSMIEVSE